MIVSIIVIVIIIIITTVLDFQEGLKKDWHGQEAFWRRRAFCSVLKPLLLLLTPTSV